MNCRHSRGFALPTVLVASVIMLIVLLVSVASTAALRGSLTAQYYNQLAKSASDAGIVYAKDCFEVGGVTWSDTSPLGPNTDCSGGQLTGFTCVDNYSDARCSVSLGDNVISTFSVGSPTVDASGNITKIIATGMTKLLRKSDNTTWRQYNQTNQLVFDNLSSSALTKSVKVLIVAGGGGGGGGESNSAGDAGAGGGAGGLIYKDSQNLSDGTYPVVVGNGGTGATGSSSNGVAGGNSSFASLIAIGGGYGGKEDGVGGSGGSGGGGGGTCSLGDQIGGAGTLGQGKAGGIGMQYTCNYRGSAGGGGYSTVGANNLDNGGGGNGGSGLAIGITGSTVSYAGGGGGGAGRNSGALGGTGQAGGGNGGSSPNGAGGAGTANTGGGGGGAGSGTATGGTGGSGVVIISYPTGSVTATGGTITTSGGNTIHRFTSSGDFVINSTGSWLYKRAITISNTNTSVINDYQVLASPFTDAGLLNNTGLVGSWHFSEDATSKAFDMSGLGNQGTISGTGTLSTSGRFGNGFYGDGSVANKVSISYDASINMTNALSIEAWVNPAGSVTKEIVSRMNSDGSASVSYELYQNGQKIGFKLFKASTAYTWTTNTDLSLNTWHHVVATWDGATAKVYVDGKLDMTPGTLASPIDSSSYGLSIGAYGNNNFLFNGKIDEVKLYNRALTGPATNCGDNSSNEVCQRYGPLGVPKIRSDYADIRFTDSTGTASYSYWQETDNKFWIKIPSLTNGSSTIYMYYGNPKAGRASNGDNTFAFFDDFSGTVINTAKWAELDTKNSIAQSNGLAFTYVTSVWDSALISKTKFYRTAGLTVSGSFKAGSSVAAPNHMMVGWGVDQETVAAYAQIAHGVYFNAGSLVNVFEVGTNYAGAGTYVANSTNFFAVKLKATGADYYNNGSAIYTGVGGSLTTSPMRIAIQQHSHTGTFNYIFVRQGSANEPTLSAPAVEVPLVSYFSL